MNILKKCLFPLFTTFRQKPNFCTNSGIPIKEVRVPVPWGHIAVKQWGDEKLPQIICGHGFMDNAGVFDKLIPSLPRRFCYLAFDIPGHGLSSHTQPGLFYYDEFYMQAFEYIRRFYGKQKVGLMGHSMGSGLCVMYTHACPENVRFVVAFELAYMPDNPMVERIRHIGRRIDKITSQEKAKDPIRPLNDFLFGMIKSWGGAIDKAAGEIWIKRAVEPVGEGWRLTRDRRCQNNQVLGQNSNLLINLITKPYDIKMCIFEATEGVRFAKTETVRKTLKSFAHNFGLVEYHALNGKHHIQLTNPEKVSPIVINFLNKYAP